MQKEKGMDNSEGEKEVGRGTRVIWAEKSGLTFPEDVEGLGVEERSPAPPLQIDFIHAGIQEEFFIAFLYSLQT